MGKRVNIVAMGASFKDFVNFMFVADQTKSMTNAEIWAVAKASDVFIHTRAFHDVQSALKTAIAEGADEIGLWGADYRYPENPSIYEDGEDEVVDLIKYAGTKSIRVSLPRMSECLIKAVQERQ